MDVINKPYEVIELGYSVMSELKNEYYSRNLNNRQIEELIASKTPDGYKFLGYFQRHSIEIDGRDPGIYLKVIKKTEDEIFTDQMEYFISNLGVSETYKNKESDTDINEKLILITKGKCIHCKMKVKGWKPMFGSFSPEWWASMREQGIDPASGHRLDCRG